MWLEWRRWVVGGGAIFQLFLALATGELFAVTKVCFPPTGVVKGGRVRLLGNRGLS